MIMFSRGSVEVRVRARVRVEVRAEVRVRVRVSIRAWVWLTRFQFNRWLRSHHSYLLVTSTQVG